MKTISRFATIPIAALTVFAVLAGCGSPPKPPSPPSVSDLPDFYLNPPIADDAIYGVGSGRASTLELARSRANAAALRDIARQVETTVESALVEYSQEAGVDGNVQVIEFVEQISRQITDTVLRGAVPQERAIDSEGRVYELVVYAKTALLEAAEEAFQRNEDAAFAQFQAQQALDFLDSQLENNPPQSQPVDED